MIGTSLRTRRRLSRAFSELLDGAAVRGGGELVGLEHEYTVVDGRGVVDFRGVIHELRLGDPSLDPGDPNAYRLPSGAAVTADGAEAEIALPPTVCARGFSRALAAGAAAERDLLAARLTTGTELVGYSTHVSVSVPSDKADRVAQLYAASFAPALMLLMDRADSLGLLVRPRPSRLELGGDFVEGEDLSAVALFAVGSVRASLAALAGATAALPAVLDIALQPDDRRFGWFVDHRAFASSLYREGRATLLRTRAGQAVTAQSQLEVAWAAARATLCTDATPGELAVVDRIVASAEPLPRTCSWSTPVRCVDRAPESAYGAALTHRRRPGFDLAPVMLTWDTAVFIIGNPDRTRLAFACVPGAALEAFNTCLDDGACDAVLRDYLSQRSGRRRLATHAQARTGGLFDRLGPRARLLTPERPAKASSRTARRRYRWRSDSREATLLQTPARLCLPPARRRRSA